MTQKCNLTHLDFSLVGAKKFQLIDNLLFVLDTDVCFWYFCFVVFIWYYVKQQKFVKLKKDKDFSWGGLLSGVLCFISVPISRNRCCSVRSWNIIKKVCLKCFFLQNVLSIWDIYTLTPIWNWPSLHIEEFLLTTEADSPSSVTWYIMTLVVISFLLQPGLLIIHYMLHSN